MTGAEHYREAERVLSDASFTRSKGDLRPVTREGESITAEQHEAMLARAQVHATLALAAASALPVVTQMMGDAQEITAWGQAIGWPGAA